MRPVSTSTESELWTYQDIVEHLLDVFDSSRDGRPLRMAKRAANEALRELSSAHRWACYDETRLLTTVAVYDTGTITYDHTGGSAERLVTLTSGAFPSDIQRYSIIIESVHYPVSIALSTTTVQLSVEENPGTDVAAGTNYTVYRRSYPLPDGCREIGELWDLEDELPITIVTPDELHAQSSFWYEDPGDPIQATIRNDGEDIGRLSIVFGPPPLTAKDYSYTYHAAPRRLITEKYSTGTVTVVAGSTTCTITTGSFSQKHVGCIIRFGTAAAEPDNVFGGLSDTTNTAAYERTIISVATAGTTCVLDSVITAGVTSVKFTVSDPLDMEYGAMLTAYQRLAEAAYSTLTKRDQKERQQRQADAMAALVFARERDRRTTTSNRSIIYNPFRNPSITTAT